MSKADNKQSEETINFLEKMLKEYKTFGDLDNPEFEDTEKIYKQIETALNKLKRLQEDYIEKDKIREKIEELNKEGYWDFLEQRDLEKTIKILKELLEEN